MLARLYAGWLLGVSLLKTLLVMVLMPRRRGLRRFEANYRDDHLLPLTVSEHDAQPAMSTCIACGRCEAAGEGPSPALADGFRGLMGFMLSASRSMPDLPAAARMASQLDDAWLDRMQERCPSRIPFRTVVAVARGYSQRLRDRSQL